VDTEMRINFTLTRPDIGARTQHDGKSIGIISELVTEIITRQSQWGEHTDLGIVQLLRNTRLEKQNARIVTPRRWAHELRTWRA